MSAVLKQKTKQKNPSKPTKQNKKCPGTSLVVQWLGLYTYTSRGLNSIPDWGTKILQAARCSHTKKYTSHLHFKQKPTNKTQTNNSLTWTSLPNPNFYHRLPLACLLLPPFQPTGSLFYPNLLSTGNFLISILGFLFLSPCTGSLWLSFTLPCFRFYFIQMTSKSMWLALSSFSKLEIHRW